MQKFESFCFVLDVTWRLVLVPVNFSIQMLVASRLSSPTIQAEL